MASSENHTSNVILLASTELLLVKSTKAEPIDPVLATSLSAMFSVGDFVPTIAFAKLLLLEVLEGHAEKVGDRVNVNDPVISSGKAPATQSDCRNVKAMFGIVRLKKAGLGRF